MDEKNELKAFTEKALEKINELSDEYKDDERSMAFLEKMTIYVKEKAEDDALNSKEKDSSLNDKYFMCLHNMADRFEDCEQMAWEEFTGWIMDDCYEREEEED
jgi:hypothetical protein